MALAIPLFLSLLGCATFLASFFFLPPTCSSKLCSTPHSDVALCVQTNCVPCVCSLTPNFLKSFSHVVAIVAVEWWMNITLITSNMYTEYLQERITVVAFIFIPFSKLPCMYSAKYSLDWPYYTISESSTGTTSLSTAKWIFSPTHLNNSKCKFHDGFP